MAVPLPYQWLIEESGAEFSNFQMLENEANGANCYVPSNRMCQRTRGPVDGKMERNISSNGPDYRARNRSLYMIPVKMRRPW